MTSTKPVRIGFIPLVDAAALLVAVDMGFAAAEGIHVELVREASWSNIRDKLAIGLFDAAHLLTPMAIASSLGLGHIKVPLAAPVNLATNGNAITVSPTLFDELQRRAGGGVNDPLISAKALSDVIKKREAEGMEPLTFGMVFPFSTHNYQLRYWMAEGGIDPDRDLRLVVLPPPYMDESLRRGHVDGFCVGAPWNSLAVDAGVGVILHFGCEIFSPAPEKVLAFRQVSIDEDVGLVAALTRAVVAAAAFVDAPDNWSEVAALLARPDRIGCSVEVIMRTLEGRLRINAQGEIRARQDYLVFGAGGACRPDPVPAAWLYAQMVRWGQTSFSAGSLVAAKGVLRPDLFDAALRKSDGPPAPAIHAFAGPSFDDADVGTYLAGFAIGRRI
jgi:two-component system, oxyanion-binding sensor